MKGFRELGKRIEALEERWGSVVYVVIILLFFAFLYLVFLPVVQFLIWHVIYPLLKEMEG